MTAPPAPPRAWPLIGVLPAMRRAPHRAFEALQGRDGDHARVRIGPHTIDLLSDPEAARALLRQPEERVTKSFFYDKLRTAFGDGLLTSAGALWQRQRALIQPLLTPRAVQAYVPDVHAATQGVIDAWRAAARAGEPVDAQAWASTLAREVTVRALFGAEASGRDDEMTHALATMEHWSAKRFWALVDPQVYPNPGRRRHAQAVALVDARIYPMIERRRADPHARDDLLARLVRARDTEGGMSERQLRDEAATLYMAGQETTANALAFALWELARRPEIQETLRQEAGAVLGTDAPPVDAGRRLPWARAVVEEALRLHPPVWSVGRETLQPVDLKGMRLPAGRTCAVLPWILHRRADVWQAPEAFRPERFHTGQQPRAYMPFGAGHRNCVGRDFAMMEMTVALGLILQAFELADATPEPVRDHALAGLVPDPAPRLKLRPVG
jgi:cytochrome P450